MWAAFYQSEPWGFRAQDMLVSKTSMQICSGLTKLKPGASHHDFMFKDRFESLDLTQQEFNALDDDEQSEYLDRQFQQMQKVLN